MRPITGTETSSGCLKHIAASSLDALYQLRGIEAHSDDGPVLVRLAELAERFMGFDYLQALVKDVSSRVPISITLTSEDMTRLLSMMQGLTYLELKKVMTQAMLDAAP